jgi:hypothetical protein
LKTTPVLRAFGTSIAPQEGVFAENSPAQGDDMADAKEKIKSGIDTAADKAKAAADKSIDKGKDAACNIGERVKNAGEKIKEQGR